VLLAIGWSVCSLAAQDRRDWRWAPLPNAVGCERARRVLCLFALLLSRLNAVIVASTILGEKCCSSKVDNITQLTNMQARTVRFAVCAPLCTRLSWLTNDVLFYSPCYGIAAINLFIYVTKDTKGRQPLTHLSTTVSETNIKCDKE